MNKIEISGVDILELGDGQLAYLTGLAARRRGLKVGVVGESPSNSAGQIADRFFVGNINRGEDLSGLIEAAKSVALDTEHVAALYLSTHPLRDRFIFPPDYLPLTQNKRLQHIYLAKAGLPLPPFDPDIETLEDLEKAAARFNYKAVLQTGSSAYDGRGNFVINTPDDVTKAWGKLGAKGNLFVEQYVPFEKEVALQIVRDRMGNYEVFPLVESTHINGQLYLAESSSKGDPVIQSKVLTLAESVSKAIPGVGLLTIELFQISADSDNSTFGNHRLLINEICIGRPHNSGHHTEGALATSQFDQIVLLAKNQRLGSTRFKPGKFHSGMLNLLGARSGSKVIEGTKEVELLTGTKVFAYGKEGKIDRKLGHINFSGTYRSEVKDRLFEALDLLNHFNDDAFRVYSL